MSDVSEDQEDSSTDTLSELDSDDESTSSSNTEEENPPCLKERLCSPVKTTLIRKLPQIMKKVQSVIDENSEDKKGRKCTILIFYHQQKEKKKQKQEKEKEEVPEESQLSNNTVAQPEPRRYPKSSPCHPPKRARKKFFR